MATIQEILQSHMENIKTKVAQRMTDYGRNASGRSVASLEIHIDGNKGVLLGSKSFLAMERGRSGGKAPYGFVGIIKQWIIDKGISVTPIPAKRSKVKYTPYERGLNSFAGAVAYTIMKQGTKLHRDRGFNDILETAVNEELKIMSDEMMFVVADSITKINQKN